MAIGILKTLFGSRNDRLLKQYRKVVVKVNALESTLQSLDDAALQAKTAEFSEISKLSYFSKLSEFYSGLALALSQSQAYGS